MYIYIYAYMPIGNYLFRQWLSWKEFLVECFILDFSKESLSVFCFSFAIYCI